MFKLKSISESLRVLINLQNNILKELQDDYYAVKCHVRGSLKKTEGEKIIYFSIQLKKKDFDKQIEKYLQSEGYDLIDIIFITKL